MSEEQSPDEYFCEECRPNLHKVYTDKNGYVFIPIVEESQFLGRFSSDHQRRENVAQIKSHKAVASDLQKYPPTGLTPPKM